MRVGFVGLGAMGAPMAGHLVAAGHEVFVVDPRREAVDALVAKGAIAAASPREAADRAGIVMACLPGVDVYREVALGAEGAVHGKTIRLFVNLGTTGAALVEALGEGLNPKGIAVLDSPISGGPPGAAAATLGIMCSGPAEAFEQAKPLLDLCAGKLVWLGERLGAAQVMKVANNIVSFTNFAVACEALVMGAKAGLDPAQMIEVMNASSGRNSATDTKIPRDVLPRTFDYGAAMYIIEKDLSLWRAEADRLGVPCWVGNTVRQLYQHAIAEGGRDVDLTTLVTHMERWAGVTLPKRGG